MRARGNLGKLKNLGSLMSLMSPKSMLAKLPDFTKKKPTANG